jgi:hypothetical protein
MPYRLILCIIKWTNKSKLISHRRTSASEPTGALGVSPDFLLYGSAEQKAGATLNDVELIQQFKEVEQMDDDDKTVIKKLIDAFITKRKLQQLAS